MARDKLKATQVEAATYTGKRRKLTDGGGLYLHVIPSGRYWRYDYVYHRKRKTLSIGVFPEVSLKKARIEHTKARQLLADGFDPSYQKQISKHVGEGQSFGEVAAEWLDMQKTAWSDGHLRTVELRLDKHALPFIKDRPISELTPIEVLSHLRRVEATGAIETASRVKTLLGQICRYAIATGRAEVDPTRDLRGALKTPIAKQFPHISDPKKLGALLRTLDGYDGNLIVRHALQIMPHVFVRPGELRQAEWSELDLDNSLWTIPAKKMKANRKHLVPLSKQVLALFQSLYEYTGADKSVFPGAVSAQRPISDGTLNAALRRLDYSSDVVVPHGFRHTASTLLNEQRNFDKDLIEAQLAHLDSNSVRSTYNKAEYIEQRKVMMQDWSDYLDKLKKKK